MDDQVQLTEIPVAKEIFMIVGWHQWADAGAISSGLPVYLINHLMDEVKFERGGTEIWMRKSGAAGPTCHPPSRSSASPWTISARELRALNRKGSAFGSRSFTKISHGLAA